ncbi:tetratricopeptide repeat-containing sensor histidine kinase [Sphingomonas sp. ASY06-1R]|uniref:tetratricopeptide repeat-containing sensor histidine kinase n=1 Tax=Sphingomonas sp. ASY06-1R TaxID=3445771 RepID=UPI003FA1CC18
MAAIRSDIRDNPRGALRAAQALTSPHAPGTSQRRRDNATADWLQAEALLSLKRPRETQAVVRRALAELQGVDGQEEIRGELVLARAGAATALGQVQDALRDNQLAYGLFARAQNPREQAKALVYISSLYLDARDYANALRYADQSLEADRTNAAVILAAQNNRAVAYSQLGQFSKAASAYQTALTYVAGDPSTKSLILRNLARAQAESGDLSAAKLSLSRAIGVSRANAATRKSPALFGVAAFVAWRAGKLDQAEALIKRALAAGDTNDAETQRDLHHTAYEIYRARGDKAVALSHFEAFRRLDDEQRALAASSSAALLNARFNFANQEVKIARLDREKTESATRFRNFLTRAMLGVAALVSTLLLIGFLSIRRSRNQVRAANETLVTTNKALEKALAAKTEFLATTSHEIRTPLNGILGMTQVILAGRALDPTLRGRIELLHGAGETMKALVDDILDVAKMETGELRIQPGEMDLKRLLQDAVQVWTGQAETKRIGIEFDLEQCPGKIIADEVRLRQIIFNLMSNAIKFTDRGQVRLAAYAEADSADDDRERLVIRVADSGIGIPPERMEDIFESFRQVDGGVTRRHGGTGLGLAICRSLARAMGGDVAVQSTLGAGSTFTLTLPLERGAVEVARADRAAAVSLATAEVLMIEPNPLGQGIMRALLGSECAGLHFAVDMEEALQAIATGGYDGVIAEGTALGLDPDAAGDLAAACAKAGARFTLLMREPDQPTRDALQARGVDHVIAKPISAPDLLSEMNRVYGHPIGSRDIAA